MWINTTNSQHKWRCHIWQIGIYQYVSYTKFERSLYKLNCIKFNKFYYILLKYISLSFFLPKEKCLVFQDTAKADFPFFTISGRFDAPKSEVHPPVWDTGLDAVRFRPCRTWARSSLKLSLQHSGYASIASDGFELVTACKFWSCMALPEHEEKERWDNYVS